jgi:hypothetical protein
VILRLADERALASRHIAQPTKVCNQLSNNELSDLSATGSATGFRAMGRTIDWTLRFGVFAIVALLLYRAGARQRHLTQSALWLPAVVLALGLLILIASLGAIFAFAYRNHRHGFN